MNGEGVKKRDTWDKIDILMRPMGGLLTAAAITLLGFITSNALSQRQAIDTNTRLYTELMSRREESESALRKDMCVSIINSFVNPRDAGLSSSVLNLEMLAYNFHESLNLKPLFTEMRRRVIRERVEAKTEAARAENDAYLDRLESMAREIVRRQMIVLEGVGKRFDRTIDLTGDPAGTTLEPGTLTLEGVSTTFTIDVLDVDRANREIRIGLSIETPDPDLGRQTKVATFGVSYFDFPMIDNTRLVGGQRCSVVLNSISDQSADITLVLFPGTYASLKEKPYYNEVIENVLKANRRLAP
ncbi:MAG: hypothetical protein EHM19_06990 [Candidatus Latescibacterota bacterium]|nr:MAG: hypothetical protein EHM19_06990 [Candidatus Latescibacterota bacterium]